MLFVLRPPFESSPRSFASSLNRSSLALLFLPSFVLLWFGWPLLLGTLGWLLLAAPFALCAVVPLPWPLVLLVWSFLVALAPPLLCVGLLVLWRSPDRLPPLPCPWCLIPSLPPLPLLVLAAVLVWLLVGLLPTGFFRLSLVVLLLLCSVGAVGCTFPGELMMV